MRHSLSASMRVTRKEIREALRDRNLVVQLVLVPLFLYPLLGFGALQIFQVSQGAAERRTTDIVLDGAVPDPVRAALAAEERIRLRPSPDRLEGAADAPLADRLRRLRDRGGEEGSFDAWLTWTAAAERESAHVYYDRSRERSTRARDLVLEAVDAHRDSLVSLRAGARGLGAADLRPWVVATVDSTPPRERGRWLIALALPVFLMVMLPQGAYYAVLDTLVGERERGTWETVLASPLARTEVLAGKFAFSVLWSVVAFALNLAGLLVFARFVLGMLGASAAVRLELDWLSLGLAFCAVVLLACSLVAIMMVVAAPARSYREGQAALSPVYLVAAFSGMFALTSGEQFTLAQAAIPIVNVTVFLKSALLGELPVAPVLLSFVVLAVLAALCLGFAARLAGREDLLFDPELTLRRLLRRQGGRA